MNIYAISDLHLSFANPKEMDIFGENWTGHYDKIKKNWQDTVLPDDIVLIPGDLSWAMQTEDAKPDIDSICNLNGIKVLLKGNHDYWWSSPSRVRSMLFNKTYIVQYDSIGIGDYVFCGTRGWILPTDKNFTQQDRVIYEREKIRLRLSLDSASREKDKQMIAMMHYPPIFPNEEQTEFSKIMDEYDVRYAVFGHIHNVAGNTGQYTDIKINQITYNLVSCDYLNFNLKKIL